MRTPGALGRSSNESTYPVVREELEGVPLESAPIVVAGGAGAGDVGWRQVADLAKALNGAPGRTRPAVDEGWARVEGPSDIEWPAQPERRS